MAGGGAAQLADGHHPPPMSAGVSFDSARGLELLSPTPEKKPLPDGFVGAEPVPTPEPDGSTTKIMKGPSTEGNEPSEDLKTPARTLLTSPSNRRYLRRGSRLARSTASLASSTPSSKKFDKIYHQLLSSSGFIL